MDNRPIGILDSGFGGLTALREMKRLLPDEELVYFGDNGRAPYGVRTPQEVAAMTQEVICFLLAQNVKAVIVACGTATSSLPYLRRTFPVPVTGVVVPAARAACAATRSGRIGVTGTELTIRAGKYNEAIRSILPQAELLPQPCQPFVTLVEQGRTEPDDPEVQAAVRSCLAPVRAGCPDTLILGCTHFPLLSRAIAAYMGPDVTLIDSGACAASETAEQLRRADALASGGSGRITCYTSGDTALFERAGSGFAGQALQGLVHYASAAGCH